MITSKTLEKIKQVGIDIDHNDAFAGKSKGNQHLFRVVKIAEFLAERLEARKDIVIAGAYLHDTPLSTGDDYNFSRNKEIIQNILKQFDISEDDERLIIECVAGHEEARGLDSIEAKIIHDADVLEKTGILGIIRHTWKLTNLNKIDPDNVTSENIKKITEHVAWRHSKLQTQIAQNIAEYLKVELSDTKKRELIGLASSLAAKSVITEEIAVFIEKFLNDNEVRLLREQLNLSYLDKHET